MTTVIIPYKIDRGFLDQAIESVKNQTVKCELMIQQGNYNKGKNINDVLQLAKGEFIKILDEDDTLPETAIENLEKGIEGFDWVCGDAEDYWYNGYELDVQKWTGRVVTLEEMLEKNCIHGGTTLYRKQMLLNIGGWNEDLWTAEEYDLHLKLMKNGYKLGYVPKIVYKYRIHDNNKSMSMNPMEKIERIKYINKIKLCYSTKK
jgi:glycosyltransferase involved in cell wall biosynthesis